MEIMTGKTGSPHVTSEHMRQMIDGIIGHGSYILESGDNMEPELVSNNSLKIKSGMMAHHGCLSTVKIGSYDTVTLSNGSQGKKRIDLVVNRYTRDASSGIEACEWVVIKGVETTGTPTAPSYTEGDLQSGATTDDCPVFQIAYDGINVSEVKKLLEVIPSNSDLLQHVNVIVSKSSNQDPNEGWVWTKYASGEMECYRNFKADNANVNKTWGSSGACSSDDIDLPDYPVAFASVPVSTVEYVAADDGNDWCAWTARTPAKNACANPGKVCFVRPYGSSCTLGHPVLAIKAEGVAV